MLFGIVALSVVGMSWTLVGIVMGSAPRKGIDPGLVQLFGSVCSVLIGAILLFLLPHKHPAVRECLFPCLLYFSGGFLNCIMLLLMSKAMQHGPNGIIWVIIQSAMIFPFLTGIIFFYVEPKPVRITGLLLILASLVLFGLCKNNEVKGGGWKAVTFLAFLLTGVVLNCSSLPSYFKSGQNVPPILRSVCTAAGTLTIAVLVTVFNRKKIPVRANLRSKYLWLFVGSLQFFGLIFAYLLLYPGMDAMAKNGNGSASHPLLISSCIIGFSLYSVFILREKSSVWQYMAMAGCLSGIVMICR